MKKTILIWGMTISSIIPSFAQKNITAASDANAPLHALQPDYPTPYVVPNEAQIKATVDKVYTYLEKATPANLIHKASGEAWNPYQIYSDQLVFAKGDFRPVSYEFGVTYSGMLALEKVSGDAKYKEFVFKRLKFILETLPKAYQYTQQNPTKSHVLSGLINPKALDDIGAMSMAFLKAKRAGFDGDDSLITQKSLNFILKEEHRLPDKTLARMRPLPNTIWLDDLYMAIPALLQLGKDSVNVNCFNEAAFQFESYQKRMFNPSLGLFMHGYLEGSEEHPEFHWARANGWALLTNAELLEHLPANHPARPAMLIQLKKHLKGLLAHQDGTGFWHQLIDRNDSYLETSATAIYTYVLAKGINQGWLDPRTYGPAAILGWQAVASKVNAQGQVDGTCVGTGLGWDPAFYFNRPISPFAAHGYGPVLLAGAAMWEMMKNHPFELKDSAIHLR
ncbi:glycoside hydrolase family 105 protein [Aquirufa nivalisilvae]|uniref:glycoside hydrolase family 88/105 protein n=1 Tax=Aquirufa nivalisilvae TaxID=2516557 RepID=UPI0022A97C09|nr:glycoside hydrolase family 88 protein [Aquirufa nivalisilvae]